MINNYKAQADKNLLYFTIPIVILVAICSSIGIFNKGLYSKETVDWLAQSMGQDISNLFFVVPALLISAFFVSKGNKLAKIIWVGTMITNIYAYVIYSFAVRFNFLFHIYCLTLGLSIYSIIYFFINSIDEDFKSWFTEKIPTKAIGIFLSFVATMFTLLWLSESLPAAITNTVPKSVINDNLLTNPVQALDFSFYLPLMFIAATMIIKKKALGYILAPMMIIFAIITNINIISLSFVTMKITYSNTMPLIIGFSIFTGICLAFLCAMFSNIQRGIK